MASQPSQQMFVWSMKGRNYSFQSDRHLPGCGTDSADKAHVCFMVLREGEKI